MKLIDAIIDAAYRRWCPKIAEPTPDPQPKQEEGPYAKAMRAYQNVKWPPDGTFKCPRCGGMNHYGMQGLNALDEAGQPRRECMNYIRKPGGSWGPREEVERVAETFGVKAPPFADPDGDTWASIFAALSATPVGQEIIAKIHGSIGTAEPPRHPADVAYISILEARSVAMEELLGINSLTKWVKIGDGIAVPNIDSAKDDAYIDRVIARSKKAE